MAIIQKYIGNEITVSARFNNGAGEPTGVTVKWINPTGGSTAFTYPTDPEVIKTGTTGNFTYSCTFLPTVVGHWKVTITSVAPASVDEVDCEILPL